MCYETYTLSNIMFVTSSCIWENNIHMNGILIVAGSLLACDNCDCVCACRMQCCVIRKVCSFIKVNRRCLLLHNNGKRRPTLRHSVVILITEFMYMCVMPQI